MGGGENVLDIPIISGDCLGGPHIIAFVVGMSIVEDVCDIFEGPRLPYKLDVGP